MLKAGYCVCGWLATSGEDTCGAWECQQHLLGPGKLTLRREDGGWRHYLCGQSVHCGSALELRCREWFDDGEHGPTWRNVEPAQYVPVRYECQLQVSGDGPPVPLFYGELGGHSVVIRHEQSFILRWPARRR